jgi:hypothetical protein
MYRLPVSPVIPLSKKQVCVATLAQSGTLYAAFRL